MTMEEFLEAAGDSGSGLHMEIGKIREQYGLESLYLIHASQTRLVWGARGLDIDWQQLVLDLVVFVREKTGLDYNTEMTGVVILQEGVSEVEYLIDQLLRNYVESHEGRIELVSLDENSGEVVVSMSGTCGSCPSLPVTLKGGVEKILKNRLPWVRNVRLPGDKPKEPASQQVQVSENNSGDIFRITEKAARKIRSLVDELKYGNAAGLRIRLLPGGCSGFKYELKIEEKPLDADEVCVMQFKENENQSAGRVFIDQQSLEFLKGSTIDHVKADDGLSETFKISNPNAKSSCGCGKSESF